MKLKQVIHSFDTNCIVYRCCHINTCNEVQCDKLSTKEYDYENKDLCGANEAILNFQKTAYEIEFFSVYFLHFLNFLIYY